MRSASHEVPVTGGTPEDGEAPAEWSAEGAIVARVNGFESGHGCLLCYEPRSTPASGAGAERDDLGGSGYEPALHPGKRGGGGATTLGGVWLRTALHPGKRGGGGATIWAVLVTNLAPPRQAGRGRGDDLDGV